MRHELQRTLILAVLVGCSPDGSSSARQDASPSPSDAGEHPDAWFGECTSTCSQMLWPRVIVDRDEASAERLAIGVLEASGTTRDCGRPHCPAAAEAAGLNCSCSISSLPDATDETLVFTATGREPVRSTVTLGAFNRCGREIAYVSVSLDADGSVQIEPTKYLNPCASL